MSIGPTRNPDLEKESKNIEELTKKFLEKNEITKCATTSNRDDIPSDQWTKMKKSAETNKQRRHIKLN